MEFKTLKSEFDADLASLIRHILEKYHLDIPGTAYFDSTLDLLSDFYERSGRVYYVLIEEDKLIGGVGLAELDPKILGLNDCCELQKLYLDERFRGQGLGDLMMDHIEKAAKDLGYGHIYLETHTNLCEALNLYDKHGYRHIDKPEAVVHSTMNRFYLKDL